MNTVDIVNIYDVILVLIQEIGIPEESVFVTEDCSFCPKDQSKYLNVNLFRVRHRAYRAEINFTVGFSTNEHTSNEIHKIHNNVLKLFDTLSLVKNDREYYTDFIDDQRNAFQVYGRMNEISKDEYIKHEYTMHLDSRNYGGFEQNDTR